MNIFYNPLQSRTARFVLLAITVFLTLQTRNAYSVPNCGATDNLTVDPGIKGCDVQFGISRQYDTGYQPSVAMISTGLVVEVHQSEVNTGLWYHVGKLHGNSIAWGPSQSLGENGYWPTVAMTEGGTVLLVYSDNLYRSGSEQQYKVFKIEPTGDQNQSMSVQVSKRHWDGGFHTSLSVNNKNVLLGVHESNFSNNHKIFYRIGHFNNDYTVAWDSGHGGIEFDTGINPHIAINDNNQIVEVHQAPDVDSRPQPYLHYLRGELSSDGKRINWHPNQSYSRDGIRPAVALTKNGLVIELHEKYGGNNGGHLTRMVGKLSTDPNIITFPADSPFVFDPGLGTYPALASNGLSAVQVHVYTHKLYFSPSSIRDRNNWMGDLPDAIRSKTLRDIVIPGSHDAGMYCNVPEGAKTQDQTIYEQLQGGIRYFDIRVMSGDPQKIYHGSSGAYVCDSVDTVMGDVKRFMQEGHKELVILKLSHFLNFGDCKVTGEYHRLRASITDRLDPWLYKGSDDPANVRLNTLIDDGGKVVVVVDGDWATPKCNEQAGFYVYADSSSFQSQAGLCRLNNENPPSQAPYADFTVFDCYSNTSDYPYMTSNQLNYFNRFNGKTAYDPNAQCDLFLLSWTLTTVTYYTEADRNLANEMNSVDRNSHGFIPNILYVDYAERARVTDTAIKMTERFNQ
jgi:hypothetical protein